MRISQYHIISCLTFSRHHGLGVSCRQHACQSVQRGLLDWNRKHSWSVNTRHDLLWVQAVPWAWLRRLYMPSTRWVLSWDLWHRRRGRRPGAARGRKPGPGRGRPWPPPAGSSRGRGGWAGSPASRGQRGWRLELQTKIRKDYTITEKAPTRAFSLLKVHTRASWLALCLIAICPLW